MMFASSFATQYVMEFLLDMMGLRGDQLCVCIYEQVHGAAMGSPISPLIAYLFMEEFKVKALSSCPQSPHLWLRYVDETLCHPGG